MLLNSTDWKVQLSKSTWLNTILLNLEIFRNYIYKEKYLFHFSSVYLEITSVPAVQKCRIFVLTIFPRSSKRFTIILRSLEVFSMILIFPRSQKFQIFGTPYHKTVKTKYNINPSKFMKFLTSSNYLKTNYKTYLNEAAVQIINRTKVTCK